MNSLWTSRRVVATAAGVPLAAPAVAASGGGESGRPATIGADPAGSLGKVLVDSRGRTVYVFGKDSRGKSSRAAAWPPVRAQRMPVSAPGLSAAKPTTTARSDGAPQALYSGHPLYRYTGDAKPGDAKVVSRPGSTPGGGSIY